nr:MAG TPA: hypothetical protein [Caudoviricetes sp.]
MHRPKSELILTRYKTVFVGFYRFKSRHHLQKSFVLPS